jgi:dUTP pyrophosphatase
LARSSTPKKFGVITANSEGVIDNTYCGNNDEWKYPALAIKDTTINEGDRICQFRIQLSQKATVWQKLKWLLSSGVKIVEVESLSGANRNGFGSTGVK